MDKDPVVKMAGAPQPATSTKAGHSPKESLLGYRWRTSTDTISTDKGDGMNLFPARRGLQPDWAILRTPEDLLKLYERQPLRHRHALAASHGTFDPIILCPWVAVQNKRKNNKSKYDNLLPDG